MVHRTWRLLQLRSGEGSGNKVSNFDANRLRRFSFLFLFFLVGYFPAYRLSFFGWGEEVSTTLPRPCSIAPVHTLTEGRAGGVASASSGLFAPMEKRERKQFALKFEKSLQLSNYKIFSNKLIKELQSNIVNDPFTFFSIWQHSSNFSTFTTFQVICHVFTR